MLNISENKDRNTITIRPTATFDFHDHRAFRDSYRYTDGRRTRYVVDLSRVERIDSAALGMLLVLRDHSKAPVMLHRPRGVVRRLLDIARFDGLFEIEA